MTGRKANRLKDALLKDQDKQLLEVQQSYEQALGKLAINFSLLHYLLERFGWITWGLHTEFAQILTRDLPTKHLVEKLRASLRELELESDISTELLTILKKAEKLAEVRNELLHAMWVFEDEKPVVCYRRRAKAPDLTAPTVSEIESLGASIIEVANELIDFNNRNPLLSVIAIAQNRKYGGQSPASPKQSS